MKAKKLKAKKGKKSRRKGKVVKKKRQVTQNSVSGAALLLKIAQSYDMFHDENKTAYVFLNNEVVALDSGKFKDFLSHEYYLKERTTPNENMLTRVVRTLNGKALYGSKEVKLYNRVAKLGGTFYYDLGTGNAVKITGKDWSIVPAPILFRRYAHQQAQVTPVKGGDPWLVFKYLNVEKEHQLLVIVYIITCFVPDIPHPIFHPYGSQGSGKTTICRIIKKLCDTSIIDVLITPKDKSELVQILAHHHICIFDNISKIPNWMSDILCQACTGGGFSKRQLYTNEEDLIFQIRRCIGINGISLLVSKPDLMDRTILLNLDRIDSSKTIEEEKLWTNFEADKPEILGGIFDVLVKAKSIYPTVNLAWLPRMADFAKWGYAVTEAMGRDGQEFIEAYKSNIDRQNEMVVEKSTLAQAVISLMDGKSSWEGTIKNAYEALKKIASTDNWDWSFPKASRMLREYLERISPNLRSCGISFEIGNKTKAGTPITFIKA